MVGSNLHGDAETVNRYISGSSTFYEDEVCHKIRHGSLKLMKLIFRLRAFVLFCRSSSLFAANMAMSTPTMITQQSIVFLAQTCQAYVT
jgi:hypothetical protein